MADGVRFELTNSVKSRRFSRPVHSTALPPIRDLTNAVSYIFFINASFYIVFFQKNTFVYKSDGYKS